MYTMVSCIKSRLKTKIVYYKAYTRVFKKAKLKAENAVEKLSKGEKNFANTKHTNTVIFLTRQRMRAQYQDQFRRIINEAEYWLSRRQFIQDELN